MMSVRRLMVLPLLLWCITPSFALDRTSYRIRSLGSNFSGLLADVYTDVVANPARLSDVNENSDKKYSLTGKAGTAGSPLTLALFSKKQWGLLGEATLNETSTGGTSTTLTSLPWTVRTTITANKTVADTIDCGLIQNMEGSESAFGFAVFPSREYTLSEARTEYRDIHVHAATQLVDNWETTINRQVAEQETLNTAVNFGYYAGDEAGRQTDVIVRAFLGQTKVSAISDSFYSADVDPDGNGRDRYNTVITTTSYIWTSDTAVSQRQVTDPTAKIGFGLEYRSRASATAGGAFLAGFSWQPEENKVTLTRTTSSTQMRGLTVSSTTTTSSSYNTTTNTANTYALFAACGSSKRFFSDRLMLAAAVRGDLSYRSADSSSLNTAYVWEQSTTKAYVTTLALSLGAEYMPYRAVAFRMGVTPSMTKTMSTQEVTPAALSSYTLHADTLSQGVTYTAGFGVTPLDVLNVDFYTEGQVLDLANFRMQVTYLF